MLLTRPPLSYIPLLPILAGVVAGVLCVCFIPADIWLVVGTVLVLAAVAALARRPVAVEIMLAASLAAVSTSMALPRQFDTVPGSDTTLSGPVCDVSLSQAGQRVYAEIVPENGSSYKVAVTYPVFEPTIEPGDMICFSGTFSLPRRDTDLPLESDMADYYRNNGISLLCYSPEGQLEVTGRSGNLLLSMKRWRAGVVDEILSSRLNEPTAVFLAAILTGDTTALTADARQEYAVAGVAHILALSGAHVAIVGSVVAILLFPLVIAGHRRARWWLTIAVLWGYAMFTGMSPSVCRAVIMASAVLLSLIFDRPRSSLNALCLAAIIILVLSPLSLMQAGFQLSFAATLAIILFSPKLMPVSIRVSRIYGVWAVAAATLAATLGTLPLVACHFHSVPVYFFISNLAAVAVMPVMIAGGLLLTVLLQLGVEPSWLIWALDGVYNLFDTVVSFVAGLPGATIGNIYIEPWLALPMYLALAFLCAFLYLRHKCYAVLAAATLLFTVGVYIARHPVYADGEAYMVRSSDATTIALHQGDTLRMLTLSPAYNFVYDSIRWGDRYRDYIATRGIRCIDIQPLDSIYLSSGAIIGFGHRHMLIAHAMPEGNVSDTCDLHADYCLVTSKWYGNPVELYRCTDADTIVLSSDINRRRRRRYAGELTLAGIPVIDLGERPLCSR